MSDVESRLKEWWLHKRNEIETRLQQFKGLAGASEERIFEEMCFCILTPQSSALAADRAMRYAVGTKLLYHGSRQSIADTIARSGVLYPENKARFIVEAREKFIDERTRTMSIRSLLAQDPMEARENVVGNVKGLGYKEASHFLRNIGYGGLAILDRHILRTLVEAGVLDQLPNALSRKTYLDIEQKVLAYARRLGIPPDALDLVMWSAKTGRVFK